MAIFDTKKQTDIQTKDELEKIQKESQKQTLPEQKHVFSVSEKIRGKVSNLPDPTRPPLGYDEHKAFDKVFPYIRLPRLHPPTAGDTVVFNAPKLPANQLILGDNLQVLRTLPSESIDLIYIDPPFFSGRNYNVIWGDSNEIRSFYDVWEGGIDSYLIWLNARLWEMRRVLKKTGSIYVHCDWHASHYIKTEMDKIFGYENFQNEIIWKYSTFHGGRTSFRRDHQIIFLYTKSEVLKYNYREVLDEYAEGTVKRFDKEDENGRFKFVKGKKFYMQGGNYPSDVWEIKQPQINSLEYIGYPTQKPEELLEKIIKSSSDKGDVVADFFCGGGSTLIATEKLGRKFIGCDSSRIAISVTLDRLIKLGEEMSGIKSNLGISDPSLKKSLFDQDAFQMKLQAEGVTEKVPNIEVSYLGVYPVDKFYSLPHEDFITFVLTCYGASRNTAEGVTHGFRPPGQSEPILIGPANPKESIDAKTVKAFFDEIKSRLEPNKLVKAKIIGWRFNRQIIEYAKILIKYITDNVLPMELDLVAVDSKEFRQYILRRFPDVQDAEFFLRFSKPPVVGEIRVKKVGSLVYEFEAVDALSTNEDSWLVNCQWDFDYQEGHFCADKDYILSREKAKDKIHGEKFEAILKATHKFEKEGEYVIACKIQDNLAGESTLSLKIGVN